MGELDLTLMRLGLLALLWLFVFSSSACSAATSTAPASCGVPRPSPRPRRPPPRLRPPPPLPASRPQRAAGPGTGRQGRRPGPHPPGRHRGTPRRHHPAAARVRHPHRPQPRGQPGPRRRLRQRPTRRLLPRRKGWFVEDLGSTNGTFLGRQNAHGTVAGRGRQPRCASARPSSSCGGRPPMTIAFDYAARSDVGMVRSNNQDSGYAGPHLLAMADGMGGHAGGDIASSTVIGALVDLDGEALGSAEAGRALLAPDPPRERPSSRRDRGRPRALDGHGHHPHRHPRGPQQARSSPTSATRAPSWPATARSPRSPRTTASSRSLVDEGRISAEEARSTPSARW